MSVALDLFRNLLLATDGGFERGLISILPIVLVFSSVAQADIYKKTTNDGVVHFTNMRPKGAGWTVFIKGTKPKQAWAPVDKSSASNSIAAGAAHFQVQGPVSLSTWEPYIERAASLYRLPVALIRAVMRVESGFHPNVVSHVGAMGLMQLMPHTASRMGVRNPFDPRENIFGGARYLRLLANMFQGDVVLTLAGYNAGENAVLKYGGVPPYDETQRYVRNVLRNFRKNLAQSAETSD